MISFIVILFCVAVATDRYYYVMAEEILWDYAPSWPNNTLTGKPFSDSEKVYVANSSEGGFIGRVYVKALYIEYTDNTFSTRKNRSADEEHLGFMGPVIRAEVGDTVYITFMNNGTHPYTMHPHGFTYEKNSEGANYQDGTFGPDISDIVQPGDTHIYTWTAVETSGPIPGSGMSSINWWYHSHNDPVSEETAGLIGPIVICAKGMCDADAKPIDVDQEVFTLFMVMDESASILLPDNINVFLGGVTPNDTAGFDESNKMHSMNGYVYGDYGSNPAITVTTTELVRWYIFGVGNEVDLHTAHWHGNTVVTAEGMRSDVERLLPGSMTTVDMIPEAVGTWLYHCHVADHISAGMMGLYTVVDCDQNCYTGSSKRSFPRLSTAGFQSDNVLGDQAWLAHVIIADIFIFLACVGCTALWVKMIFSKSKSAKSRHKATSFVQIGSTDYTAPLIEG